MSAHPLPKIRSFIVDSTCSGKQYYFVKQTSDTIVGLASTKGENVIGVLMNAPTASGQIGEVAMIGGGAFLKLGSAVGLNADIVTTANGDGQLPDAANQAIRAQALKSGASGDVIPVNLTVAKSYQSA